MVLTMGTTVMLPAIRKNTKAKLFHYQNILVYKLRAHIYTLYFNVVYKISSSEQHHSQYAVHDVVLKYLTSAHMLFSILHHTQF